MKWLIRLLFLTWAASLWFLYPLPGQHIALLDRIEASGQVRQLEEAVTPTPHTSEERQAAVKRIWVKWFVVALYVSVGFALTFALRTRSSAAGYVLILWSAIYVGFVALHFLSTARSLDLGYLESVAWEWKGVLELDSGVSTMSFLTTYFLLPATHSAILVLLFVTVVKPRRGGRAPMEQT